MDDMRRYQHEKPALLPSVERQSIASHRMGRRRFGLTSTSRPLYLFDGGSRCIMIRIGPVG
jgi:hypothetical protein